MRNTNKLVAIGVAIATLLLSGCAQTQQSSQPLYNANNEYIPPAKCQYTPVNLSKQEIVFKGGKPFRVPKLTVRRLVEVNNPSMQMRSILQQNGLTCNIGDVLWFGGTVGEKFISLREQNNIVAAYTYVGKASQVSQAGCTHPLSNQEYNFYRENEKQRQETILRLLESSRSNTVEVSGTMNHNVYRY